MRIDSLHLEGVGPFENTTIEFPKGKRDDLADVYLLVGKNGCGKTTAVQVLAALLGRGDSASVNLERRFWGNRASAVLRSGDLTWRADRRTTGSPPPEPFVVLANYLPSQRQDVGVSVFEPSDSVQLSPKGLANRADWAMWQRSLDRLSPDNLGWAAFTYAGQRTLGKVNVTTIQEQHEPPLRGSLNFESTADATQRLAQWIANQDFKRLKAEQAGLTERAEILRNGIARIEQAIRDLTELRFSFEMSIDDINVRARLEDDVLEFDLLPEGLKSVVSWLSDLLMRLERVGWRDSLPIHQREFLLLLDEIDVHLHPAWQRRLLPALQRIFPKAQIVASTHSPFVAASLADGAVIELTLDGKGRSTAQAPLSAPLEMSYSQTMRRLFGIESDFDVETEQLFKELQATTTRVLKGETGAREELDRRAAELKNRGEEIAQLVQFELNQLNRLKPRPTGT